MNTKVVTPRSRPWLSGLLSLLIPGLGQLRNGAFARALTFFALPFVADALLLALVVGLQTPFWGAVTAYGVVRLLVAADAWLGAPRAPARGSRALHIVRLLVASAAGCAAMFASVEWRHDSVMDRG